jgi:hypothetical protein
MVTFIILRSFFIVTKISSQLTVFQAVLYALDTVLLFILSVHNSVTCITHTYYQIQHS